MTISTDGVIYLFLTYSGCLRAQAEQIFSLSSPGKFIQGESDPRSFISLVHVRTTGSFTTASFTILFLECALLCRKACKSWRWRRTNKKSKILTQSSGNLPESLNPNFAVPGPLLCIYTVQLWRKTKNMSTKTFTGMTQNHRSPLPVIRDISKDGSTKEPSWWVFFSGRELSCSFSPPTVPSSNT